MKTQIYRHRSSITSRIGILLFLAILGYGCVKEDNPTIATFKGETIYSFLQKDSINHYSEFVKIIDRAGLKGMLSAYGNYTCLAPTNAALKAYYASFGSKFNIDSLPQSRIEYIAKTHIVNHLYKTLDLLDGIIPNVNMNDRFIEIRFAVDSIKNTLQILLNGTTKIISKDNLVYNGVIQGINSVLQPTEDLLPKLIHDNGKSSIFYSALQVTHLNDSLTRIEDVSYVPVLTYMDESGKKSVPSPPKRKYGYTIFVESDDVFAANNIHSLEDLKQKAKEWYPSSVAENDYTNRENCLNKFISYHLVNKAIYEGKFFYGFGAYLSAENVEYVETMYTNRLFQVSSIRGGTTINPNTDHEVNVVLKGASKDITTTVNGVYHMLDNILVYSPSVENVLSNTRIRFDITCLFPELTTNNIRGVLDDKRFGIPPGYLKGITYTQDTYLLYLAGGLQDNWNDYQGDELMGLGSYDITFRLMPVPPGEYELRFGYNAYGNRSVTQIYIDSVPVGIPLDLGVQAASARIGWIKDILTDDNGIENDKLMRNHGYMKAPNSFYSGSSSSKNNMRDVDGSIRRIIGKYKFETYRAHTIRFKSVLAATDKQCMMDYFEYVPKSVYSPADGSGETRY